MFEGKMPPTSMLGIEHSEADLVKVKPTSIVHDYQFTVCPINRYHSREAEQRFIKFAGSLTPQFDPDRFDHLRERMQTTEKKEREKMMRAMGVLYTEGLASAFLAQEKGTLDLAKFEALMYPKTVLSYEDTLRAVGFKKRLWWKPVVAAELENVARMALDKCGKGNTCTLSFTEFYGLFWNFHHPFNTLAYLCMITRQTVLITTEFIDAFAAFLNERIMLLDPKDRDSPILMLGPRIGKIGALLNASNKLPVTVMNVHENPNTNPYMMFIPPNKQTEFRPNPIIKMKPEIALQKYEPRIVIMADMEMNVDDTQIVRQQGSVREYYYIGFADSYVEGRPFETWGKRNDDSKTIFESIKKVKTVPPLVEQGWVKVAMPSLSRWLLHRHDSTLLQGCGQVTGFFRRNIAPTARDGWISRFARLKPFF